MKQGLVTLLVLVDVRRRSDVIPFLKTDVQPPSAHECPPPLIAIALIPDPPQDGASLLPQPTYHLKSSRSAAVIISMTSLVTIFNLIMDCFSSNLFLSLHRRAQDEIESPREPITCLARAKNNYHLQWPISSVGGLP